MPRFFSVIVISALAIAACGASLVYADEYGVDTAVGQTGGLLVKSVAGRSTVPEIVGEVVKVALSFIGILFFGLMLYAGFVWMRAMGNTENVTRAKDIMEGAAIGIVIVLAAYALTTFVFERLVTP